jgi:hypothetical protein
LSHDAAFHEETMKIGFVSLLGNSRFPYATLFHVMTSILEILALFGHFFTSKVSAGQASQVVRRPAGLNSPAPRSAAGFVMREIQTGLHKPESGTKQRLTKSADNSAPVYFPKCAWTSLGSWVSFHLPLA